VEYKDYYKTLGVSKSATEKEIKSAYRKLARENHPDVHQGDKKAEKRFQEINEAYEVLSDAENRKKYDQLGSNWRQAGQQSRTSDFSDLFGGAGGGTGASGFSSFFDQFFGGGGSRRASAPTTETPVEVEISLSEAFLGTTRQLEFNSPQACAACRGNGVVGNGLCPQCRGAGQQSGRRSVEVRIPAGVTQGSKVKAQNVLIQVNLKPDPDYEIKGRDLIRRLPIELYGAILGSEVKFQTPLGKEVNLKIPPESQNGRSFRLAGQGLPAVGGKQAGDLYIKLEVNLPTKLSERERELFSELARLRGR
jgi:molecular chaperone DnaJ